MEAKGKIIEIFEPRTGSGAHGDWMSASYLFETSERYPKKFVFDVFGKDRIERLNVAGIMAAKNEVVVYFDIEAHEHNGRWFNSVRAWDVRIANEHVPTTAEEANAAGAENKDDLPFG